MPGPRYNMDKQRLNKYGWYIVLGTIAWPFIQAVFFFFSAGRLDVWQGWLNMVLSTVVLPAGIVLVWLKNPELLNHRGQWRKKKDTPRWDRVLIRVFAVFGYYLPAILAGLDLGRYRWSPLPTAVTAVGVGLFIAGNGILHWAMLANRHFEVTVRLQRDRDHRVVTDGPYQFIRHPGYAGAILWVLSGPLIWGSGAGLIPAVVACLLLIVRTFLEDRMLRKELDGYADYAAQVRYRLLYGVW